MMMMLQRSEKKKEWDLELDWMMKMRMKIEPL
jgi:hypothetical protein